MVKAVRLLQERKTSSEDQTVIGSEDEDDTDVDDNDDDDIPVARLLFSGQDGVRRTVDNIDLSSMTVEFFLV